MKRYSAFLLATLFLLPVASCTSQKQPEIIPDSLPRKPAVAGQFYPGDSAELERRVAGFLRDGQAGPEAGEIRAIVVPHAGYEFSGAVAASAYRLLDPAKPYRCVFLLGPSHHVGFEGAALYLEGNFRTPLGVVPVDRELGRALAKGSHLFTARADAHAKEHAIEVQLPFLQHIYRDRLRILPILLGDNSPETCAEIAGALKPYLAPEYLFVISTDFSHYPSYDDAVRIDKATAAAVARNSISAFVSTLQSNARKNIPNLATSACGWTGLLTLLSMTAGDSAGAYHLVQYRNSGDTPIGDRNSVVGYWAISYTRPAVSAAQAFALEEKDKRDLLAIARTTVQSYVGTGELPAVDTARLSTRAKTPCGAFVTLRKNGDLRGCIGSFEPMEPLWKVVQMMAVAAATQDYRFDPVRSDEVPALHIEISALTPMRKIRSIDEIQLGRHGIYIRKGSSGGTFLPQVATETGWTKEQFLGYCARDKAGLGWEGWKEADIYIYEAIVFEEETKR